MFINTTQSVEPNTKPEFIRLPKSGVKCQYTGLSRSKLNSLILPSPANLYRPAVKSVSIRQRGATRGTRLIIFDSLVAYLHSALADNH